MPTSSAVELTPAAPLLLQMQALAALGLNVERIRTELGELPRDAEGLMPLQTYRRMWAAAQVQYARPGLATAMAAAIPFGAFGTLDYLAGSAATVAAAVASLELHMRLVAAHDTRLEVEHGGDDMHWLRFTVESECVEPGEEFTLAVVVHRLRYLTGGAMRPARVTLRAPASEFSAERERLLGAPVRLAHRFSAFAVSAADWQRALVRADPFLHDTLKRIAGKMQLAPARTSDLEQALRARLRDALPAGVADPARLARLLGLSERSLQRRLAEIGRSVSAIKEDFRRDEALRLLEDRQVALVEIAGRLGYSEQTSFTRAFRRWTASAPAAWRAARPPAPA